jgi:hypothetical protein
MNIFRRFGKRNAVAAGALAIAAIAVGAHLAIPSRYKCGPALNPGNCATHELRSIAEKEGPLAAFEEMREYLRKNPDAIACHTFTHAIGEGTFRAMQAGRELALDQSASACGYGFYHGLLEAMLSEASPEDAAALCRRVDAAFAGRGTGGQCFHGIGHGFMADPDLAASAKDRLLYALDACERLTAQAAARAACASGAMNALAILYTSEPAEVPDPEHPLAICSTQKTEYQEACYANMNVVLAKISGNDFRRALRSAGEAPAAWRALTVRLVAAYFTSFQKQDAAKVADLSKACGELPLLHANCREGIAHGLLEFGADGREYEQAFAFCRSLTEDRRACMAYALAYLPSLHPSSDMPAICRAAGAEFHDLCPDRI